MVWTPRCLVYQGVATTQCPEYQAVKTPGCPGHQGVAIPGHRGVDLKSNNFAKILQNLKSFCATTNGIMQKKQCGEKRTWVRNSHETVTLKEKSLDGSSY